MAAKVNTKFVAVLVGALVLLAGAVGGAAWMVMFKSAKELVQQGDSLMSAGNATEAEKLFGKAVNKEPTNVEYLRKWRASIEKLTPTTQTTFDAKYPQYTLVRKRIADLLRTDVASYRDLFDVYLQTIQNAGYNRQYTESLSQATTDALAQFGDGSQGYGEGEVLRRYRALANLRIMLESKNLKEADEQLIKADFEAALAADPADVESVLGLHSWHIFRADRLMNDLQRPDEAVRVAEQGKDLVRAFREKDPNEPKTKLTTIGWLLADARRQVRDLNKPEDRKKVADKLRVEGMGALEEATNLLKKIDPSKIDAQTVSQLIYLEGQLDESGKYPRSREIVDLALKAQPGDASLMITKSEAEALARDYVAAITTLQQVRDLPNPTLSVPGRMVWYRKNEALFRQAALSIRAWEQATDPDPAKLKQIKSDWLAKAKSQRAELAKIDPDNSPRMMYIDGKIKLADEDYQNAQRLLLGYISAVGEADGDALFSAANASFHLNQPGKAKELLEKALSLNSYNIQAMLLLGEVEIRLKNLQRARDLYAQADSLVPNNDQIKNRLRTIDQERGTIKIDDPVLAYVAEYRRKLEEKDDKGAVAVLQEALAKTNYDARIVVPLLQQQLAANDPESAKALIEKALTINTNEEQKKSLQNALGILQAPDPTQARLLSIDTSPLKPAEKLAAKLNILSTGGEKYQEQAKAAKAELESTYPDEPIAIETLFIQAIRDNNIEAARQWKDKAVAQNIDTYDGVTFKARLAAAEKQRGDAITMLQQAAQRYNFNVEAWRVLAALQMEEGRATDAVLSMEKALALRPDDVTTVLQYAASLQAAGRNDDALTLTRTKSAILADSQQLRDEWLKLEGMIGKREDALRERERDILRDPNNRMYKVQAAALNVDLRRWEEARRRIDEIRQAQDGLDIVQIDATWSADQSDLAGAQKTFRDYVDGLVAKKASKDDIGNGLMAFARFMVQRGRPDVAVTALEEARPLQDPQRMQADRMLAELYLDMAESDKAIETLRRVVDSGKDGGDDSVRLRLAEALIQARRFDEGEKELAALGPATKEGAVAMLLRSDAAMGRGDGNKAIDLLDKAVAAFPSNAGVFLKRAQAAIELNRNNSDIVADLDQVIRLDPRLWQAHQLKAVVYQKAGRKEDVIGELRAILVVDPSQDEILGLGLRMLLADDRDDEAVALAEEVAKRRGAPGTLYANIGDLFATLGRTNRAIAFYKSAAAADSRTPHVVRYVNSLLNQKPPNLTEAENALANVQTRITKDPELLLSRAGVRRARNAMTDARKDVVSSMKLLPVEQVGAMQSWFNSAMGLFGAKDLTSLLDTMPKEGANPDWVAFFRGRILADDPSTQSAGIAEIGRIAKTTKIPALASLASREAAGRLYLAKKYDEAMVAMKEIVATNPDDSETLNNLAYMICKDLNKPEEALPFAKKAYELRPKSPELLDTYGLVLMSTGKLDEAEKIFQKAIGIAAAPSTQVTILLHMVEMQAKQGKKEEAKQTLNRAKTLFGQTQSLTKDMQKEDIERLEKLVEAS